MSADIDLSTLISLAEEPSSEKRRELLRQVTDLFFQSPTAQKPREHALFDDVLDILTREMETQVRAELAERLAFHTSPPNTVLRRLALDKIEVAGSVLSRSPALSEDLLLEVARDRGQGHLRAISGRAGLTEAISDVLVDRGDDTTLGVLLRNQDAPLSRTAAEAVVDRAIANPDLHESLIRRRSMPIDLLNEMYFVVEQRLRDQILARNGAMSPAEVQEALSVSRKKLAIQDGALPPDFAETEILIRKMRAENKITPTVLASFLRFGERTRFLVAFAEMTDLDFETARRITDNKQIDALAVVCKAADFDKSLFLTITVLILEDGEGMGKAQKYAHLYTSLTKETAQRTLRFWRLRREAGEIAA